jgi:cell division septal protein FtsQ
MWFKRDHRNRTRRQGRGHVLDVKMRSNQVKAARVRLVTIAGGVVFGTVFGLYLIWRTGELVLDKFVYENPDFAIQNIEVQTDGVITADQLRRWSGVRLGQNLIALDLAAVKRNLELVSKLDSVSIERILPQTLKIRVTERTPIAQIDLPCSDPSGALTYSVFELDARGNVLQPVDPAQSTIPFMQLNAGLTGIVWTNISELVPGHRISSPELQAALKLITVYRRSPMLGLADLRRIDVCAPGVITATTAQGSEVTFGLQGLDQQLRRWRQIYDWGFRQGKNIATVDLSVDNDIPVNWVVVNPIPDNNSKPAKSVKPRRKNV